MPACKSADATLALDQPDLTSMAAHALFMTLLALLVMAAPVRADETYVCEDGRTITVRFGELEKLAQTEPCIARYVKARPLRMAPPAQAAVSQPVAFMDVPLPVRKPPILKAEIAPEIVQRHAATEIIVHHEAPPASQALTTNASASDDGVLRPRVEQVVFRHAPHHFYSDEPLPKGPADYRRVPIINAAPGEQPIFYHTR